MKKILVLILALLFCFVLVNPISANETKVIDEADVLTEQEEIELTALCNKYIEKTDYDMVIYFTYQNEYFEKYNDAITRLADDTFDYQGYGIGSDFNGIIICVDTYYRDYTITTCGDGCIKTYTDYALDDIYSVTTSYFRNDDWYGGSKGFVDKANYVYDNYDYYHPKRDTLTPALGFGVIAGVIATIIRTLILRGQMKNTSVKRTANEYVKGTNLNILRSGEVYLFTTRTVHKIERADPGPSNNGHSSIHISSSGRSHGGGGSHRF